MLIDGPRTPTKKPTFRQSPASIRTIQFAPTRNETEMSAPAEELDEWQPHGLKSPERNPSLNQERPSSYGLVDQILQGYESQSSTLLATEAIPDATPDHLSSPTINESSVSITDLIGTDLPPAAIAKVLFDVYVRSVHWFMLIFHEPSLREELSSLLETGRTSERSLSRLLLILVILLIATKYVVVADIKTARSSIDINLLQAKLLATIEKNFLAVLDQDNIGAIQVCILLSSFYFYHGRPNRCLAINSAAIRMAQNMKFHHEASWYGVDTIEREQRRRVWWALYVLDGYGSITYGTTTTIKGSQCQLALPQNIDDTSDQCPGFGSSETFEDGTTLPVTTLSYQRYKFRLYRIAEPIMGEIYFHDRRPIQDLIKQVQDINTKLLEWEKSVPVELRPESFSLLDADSDPLTKIFQLQAIALQLSYDNVQLVLHRPLLVYNGVLSLPAHLRVPQPPDLSSDFWEASKELCWNSARRTACVDEYLAALRPVQNLYITSYIGIQTFTAGVMLGIFALSKPFAAQAQDAKQNIGRLVKMPKLLAYRTTISDQTGRVLQRLLRLILDEELKALTLDEDGPTVSRQTSQGGLHTISNRPATASRSGLSMYSTANNTLPFNTSRMEDGASEPQASDRARSHCQSPAEDEHSIVPSAYLESGSLNQQLMELDDGAEFQGLGQDHGIVEAAFTIPSTGAGLFDSGFLGELDDLGQGWMWEDCHQFS